MKKIAIIGSESFLAQNIIKYFDTYHSGLFEVACYDFKKQEDARSINYKQIDFSSPQSVSNIDFNVDTVLFFTGRTGTVNGFKDYESFVTVNEIYLLRVLDEYVKQESKARFIYPGSRLVFKANEKDSINESSARELKSIYAVNKQASENYLNLYNQFYGVDYVILRICTPFGSIIDSDGSYGTFEIFRKQAKENGFVTIFGDGKERKTYTDMLDICEAFYRLAAAENVKYRDYNLGGKIFSMNEAVSLIVSDLKAEIRHVPWPKEYLLVDGGTVVFDSNRLDKEFDMHYHNIDFANKKGV